MTNQTPTVLAESEPAACGTLGISYPRLPSDFVMCGDCDQPIDGPAVPVELFVGMPIGPLGSVTVLERIACCAGCAKSIVERKIGRVKA